MGIGLQGTNRRWASQPAEGPAKISRGGCLPECLLFCSHGQTGEPSLKADNQSLTAAWLADRPIRV